VSSEPNENKLQNRNTVKPVLKGPFGTMKKWPYKTGDLFK